jgi:hypothetical protein
MSVKVIRITPRDLRLGRDYRSIHLVDVENLLGGTTFGFLDVEDLAEQYRVVSAQAPGDLTVVASSHVTASPVWFGWSNARRLVRSGENGADLELIHVMATEDLAHRFDRVVVGSGDGIFAEPLAALQAVGCDVTIVSRPGALSARLRLAVRDIRLLKLEPETTPAVVQLRRAS